MSRLLLCLVFAVFGSVSAEDLCETTFRDNCYFIGEVSPCSKSCGKGVMTVQFLCDGQPHNFTGDCCMDACYNEDAPTGGGGGGGGGGVQSAQPSKLCHDTFPVCMSAAKAQDLTKRDFLWKDVLDTLDCFGDSASQPLCRCPTHSDCYQCGTDSDCKWAVQGEYCVAKEWETSEETSSGYGACPCPLCAIWANSGLERNVTWLSEVNQKIPCPCRASSKTISRKYFGMWVNRTSFFLYPKDTPEDDWKADLMCINRGDPFCKKYHPGAIGCLRSTTTISGAGQQCCYDSSGDLIGPDQSGAGTPDKCAVTKLLSLSFIGHQLVDVVPYKLCCDYCTEAGSCERYKSRRRGSNSHCLNHV